MQCPHIRLATGFAIEIQIVGDLYGAINNNSYSASRTDMEKINVVQEQGGNGVKRRLVGEVVGELNRKLEGGSCKTEITFVRTDTS